MWTIGQTKTYQSFPGIAAEISGDREGMIQAAADQFPPGEDLRMLQMLKEQHDPETDTVVSQVPQGPEAKIVLRLNGRYIDLTKPYKLTFTGPSGLFKETSAAVSDISAVPGEDPIGTITVSDVPDGATMMYISVGSTDEATRQEFDQRQQKWESGTTEPQPKPQRQPSPQQSPQSPSPSDNSWILWTAIWVAAAGGFIWWMLKN